MIVQIVSLCQGFLNMVLKRLGHNLLGFSQDLLMVTRTMPEYFGMH